MKITLNNQTEEIKGYDRITIQELLDIKKFTFKSLIVKVNGIVIKKEDYDKTVIYDGDDVAVIHLLAGG